MTTQQLDEVQSHALSRLTALGLPGSADELHRALRARLIAASNAGELTNPLQEIFPAITLLGPDKRLHDAARAAGVSGVIKCIFGGDKNFARDPALKHFSRPDGAWFDFSVIVSESTEGLELVAYTFEIRLPPGHGVPFVRFDLNLPGHANESREMRSHIHPGTDALQIPSAILAPVELLELFLAHLRPARDRRAPTTFEANWHGEFLERHRPAGTREDLATAVPDE